MSSDSVTTEAIERIVALRRRAEQRAASLNVATPTLGSARRAAVDASMRLSGHRPSTSVQRSLLRDVRECDAVYMSVDDGSDTDSYDTRRPTGKRMRSESDAIRIDAEKLLADAKRRDALRFQSYKINHLPLSRLEEVQSWAERSMNKVSFLVSGDVGDTVLSPSSQPRPTPKKQTPMTKRHSKKK